MLNLVSLTLRSFRSVFNQAIFNRNYAIGIFVNVWRQIYICEFESDPPSEKSLIKELFVSISTGLPSSVIGDFFISDSV